MMESTSSLAELLRAADREIARLNREENITPRDELRFRLWPFLADLTSAIEEALDAETEQATIPVDVAARAVGLILTMANRLAEFVSQSEMDELAVRATSVTEDLLNLCDPEELARYSTETPEPLTVVDGTIVEPLATPARGAEEPVKEVVPPAAEGSTS